MPRARDPATALQRFDLAAIAPMPWKNGGGATREIVCWPPGAGLEGFGWRVSVASIDGSGPFSAFPGVEREIMLLAGDGVHLQGPGIDHRLNVPGQPFAFAGELPLDCTLLGGASTDFNFMRRRDAWTGRIDILAHAVAPGSAPAGLCMVLAGAWCDAGGSELGPGQGLWWSALVPQAGGLVPVPGTGALLAWIAMAPVLLPKCPAALMDRAPIAMESIA